MSPKLKSSLNWLKALVVRMFECDHTFGSSRCYQLSLNGFQIIGKVWKVQLPWRQLIVTQVGNREQELKYMAKHSLFYVFLILRN